MAPSDVAVHESASEQGTRRITNDFSIQVATVNGSGSQTANLVLLRSIFQMGVPVSGKNLFPSNIAGLPTWFTIRANKDGYIGRKKEIDFLVAMNPETAREDVLSLEPGAAVLYDEPLKLDQLRDDLVVLCRAVRQAGGAGLPEREAAQARAQHDLRRDAGEAARHRPGRDGAGAGQAVRQEGQGRRTEPGRAQGGLGLRRGELHQARPAARRAHGQDPRHDPHRGQRRGGHRLHDGGRDGGRVVPDYAVLVAGRVAHRLHARAPRGQGDGEGHLRDRAGRGRAGGAGNRARRGLGGRAGDDRHRGPRHLAHVGVHRPGLLHRAPGGHLRHPAGGAVDGPPDPHVAGRHPLDRRAVARRHQAGAPDPVLGRRDATRWRSTRSTSPSGSRRRCS